MKVKPVRWLCCQNWEAIGVSLEGLLPILILRPIIAFIASVDETWQPITDTLPPQT
jgi:hypothetical protein